MAHVGASRLALVLAGLTFLSACEEGKQFKLFNKPLFAGKPAAATEGTPTPAASGTTIEKDVESPDVFHATDKGLWDGRPSLGGVWVAHPDVTDPERVIIRNQDNGKFIIGALFRRERENPGPAFQVSSDAAAELGMQPGTPVTLNAVALRTEEVVIDPPANTPTSDTLEAPVAIGETTLDAPKDTNADPVVAIAATAIEAATNGADQGAAPLSAIKQPAAKPAPKPVSNLKKPFIQIGIFSVESNANDTADRLRKAGIIPAIKVSSSSGKTYWRVIVGPAARKSERSTLIKKIKSLGYTDAYAVTN